MLGSSWENTQLVASQVSEFMSIGMYVRLDSHWTFREAFLIIGIEEFMHHGSPVNMITPAPKLGDLQIEPSSKYAPLSRKHVWRFWLNLSNSWEESKGKIIPATGLGGRQGFETSRLPHFLDNRLRDSGEVVSLTCRPLSNPRKILGTHFC
jgi:hypothetical protein